MMAFAIVQEKTRSGGAGKSKTFTALWLKLRFLLRNRVGVGLVCVVKNIQFSGSQWLPHDHLKDHPIWKLLCCFVEKCNK